jgi:putative transposase
MNRMDQLHMKWPFAGVRMLRDLLRQEDLLVGRKHIATLMRRMGLEALYRKPRTTQRHPRHKVYPYLLRNLQITRPNQAWAMDITYIPMAKGFVYLVAVVDWYTRRVLSWQVAITMDVQFCLEVVEEAIARYGRPDIMNTDQGSQFTSHAFTALLKAQGVRISMDGRGAWRDNIVVERLWRSVKYEEVYLHAYDSVSAARAGIKRYFQFYNCCRPHSSLAGQTPDQVYFDERPQPRAA